MSSTLDLVNSKDSNLNVGLESKLGSTATLPHIEKPKVYPYRWFILLLFVFFSASNGMQWIQYTIISPVMTEYYGISIDVLNWTSMIYMVLYIPFIFPASFLLDKLGLRLAVTLGIAGTCLGSLIKIASVDPSRFWVSFLGQAVTALSNVFVISMPARIAAVWFGPDQVSSACSIGVFGNQIGIAAGFLIPPVICPGGTTEEVSRQLYILFIGVGVLTSTLFILILIFFRNGPPTPPSYAAQQQSDDDGNFLGSLKSLVLNKSFVCLFFSYGINTGVFYAMSTLLTNIILTYYKGADQDAGRIGLVIVVAGMGGAVCCGYLLDRYRKFKATTVGVYAFSLLGMVLFTFTIDKGLIVVYITAGALGFFMTGLLPVGFELGSELTYPEPEGTQAGLLNAASQFFGIIFIFLYSTIFDNVNDTWANIVMCIALAVGLVLISLVSSNTRRQAAIAQSNK